MKILFLLPEYSHFGGGIITYYRNLLNALIDEGCAVKVLEGSAYLHHPSRSRKNLNGIDIEALESNRVHSWTSRCKQLGPLPELRSNVGAAWAMAEQALESMDADVVEATDFGLLGLPALIGWDRPLIMQGHASIGQIGLHDPSPARTLDAYVALGLESWAGQQSTQWQTYSEANAEYWRTQTGATVKNLRPAWSESNYSSQEQNYTCNDINVFGRIQHWKGPRILCDALRILKNTPNINWHGRDVYLPGANLSTAEQLQADYPDIWGSRIRPTGPKPYSDVLTIQKQSLLNLVPSTWDVFNFTVVEAMNSGRPVVCSNGAGASELIEDGITGFVYDGSSAAALAATLDRALSMPEERLKQIGLNAQRHISVELSPRKVARERIAAYEEAIQLQRLVRKPPVPDWITQLVVPQKNITAEFAFMEQFPLKSMIRHTSERLLRKIGFRKQ